MTARDLLMAINDISDEAIIEADEPKKSTRVGISRLIRWIAAACICISLSAVLVASLITPEGESGGTNDGSDIGYAQSPDVVYGAWFGDFFYRELSGNLYFDVYPELAGLAEKTAVGYEYRITDAELGEYIGEFPPVINGISDTGRAYHWIRYPDYLSIIIVKHGEGYTFFVADGNDLGKGVGDTSDAVLDKLGMPGSVVSVRQSGGEAICNADSARILCQILSGKDRIDPYMISFEKWWAWCEKNGNTGVGFGDTGPTFATNEARAEYAIYYGSTIKGFEIITASGFDIRLTVDAEFGYASICGRYYSLSRSDAEDITSLFATDN